MKMKMAVRTYIALLLHYISHFIYLDVPLNIIASFNRIQALSTDHAVISQAVKKSTLLQVIITCIYATIGRKGLNNRRYVVLLVVHCITKTIQTRYKGACSLVGVAIPFVLPSVWFMYTQVFILYFTSFSFII